MFLANEELKRVDHLIYVSLKYTRTGDVLKSVINRLVDSYTFFIDGILNKLEEEHKIFEAPIAPLMKVEEIKKAFPEDLELHNVVDFYAFLRKVNVVPHTSHNEFRRNVKCELKLEDDNIRVNIDTVTLYYKRTIDVYEQFAHYLNE